jgi:hypothetical protein
MGRGRNFIFPFNHQIMFNFCQVLGPLDYHVEETAMQIMTSSHAISHRHKVGAFETERSAKKYTVKGH